MTRERALELAEATMVRSEPPVLVIADTILTAVVEEREACAKIAEEESWGCDTAEVVAAKIRQRGK